MRRLIVISGAGFSAESGVRTFRTDTESGKALWDEYDLEEVCNIHAFRGNFYHKTHMFYNKRRAELPTVHPNAAHLRVAEWYRRYPGQVVNMTTNVDDLLERAGVPKEDTLYIHGYLKEIRYKLHEDSEEQLVDIGYDEVDPDQFHWCKPNVVFFGENAPAYGPMNDTLELLTNQDLVIVVGCSNTVINFNWELFPAVMRGTKVVVVNPAIRYDEQMMYENAGVLVYRTGAVDAFNNPGLIKIVENHLEGKTPLQSKEK
ncbi:Sir2 (NAD-dependent deacetylase) [Klebsiella phage KpS8]|uniref:Sir2-like protein n=2 Tax=Mydovirus KpS8 TaxID=2723896 RepID=A0A6H0X4E6_9CAUD|nr:Sir2 (NAD-dependent deacetylase) [Klebsiella phage KpS8]QIW88281.1 Sir2-like protein [Klebsiella phage KpS8]QOI68682.1 putative Sir2-like protein [Klebsiella phage vB_KpnM_Seu621]